MSAQRLTQRGQLAATPTLREDLWLRVHHAEGRTQRNEGSDSWCGVPIADLRALLEASARADHENTVLRGQVDELRADNDRLQELLERHEDETGTELPRRIGRHLWSVDGDEP